MTDMSSASRSLSSSNRDIPIGYECIKCFEQPQCYEDQEKVCDEYAARVYVSGMGKCKSNDWCCAYGPK